MKYHKNSPFEQEHFVQKWTKIPLDQEVRVLLRIYDDLQQRKNLREEMLSKRQQMYQKYTKLNREMSKRTSSSKTKIDKLSKVRPKTSIESAKDLGNIYSRNNFRWKKSSTSTITRPSTTPLIHSAYKLAKDVGNHYSSVNRSFISIRDKKVSNRNNPKMSTLQSAKEYGNEWGKRISSSSDKSRLSSSSNNKDMSGIAKIEFRKEYGNYCSLQNRVRILQEYEKEFHLNHVLRSEYNRALEKISEFEMNYLSSVMLNEADDYAVHDVKKNDSVESEKSKREKESEHEIANVDYDPKMLQSESIGFINISEEIKQNKTETNG